MKKLRRTYERVSSSLVEAKKQISRKGAEQQRAHLQTKAESRPGLTPVADERGQALVEFVLILPFLFLIFAALVFFGRLIYSTIAVNMSSYDACRAAVESLRQDDGQQQGLAAGRETLNGFSISAASARLSVQAQGKWDRGAWVRCQTQYTLKTGDIPMVQLFYPGGAIPLRSTLWSRIEMWRSWWER